MNSKNAASSYLKADSQTMWARNTANGPGAGGGKLKRDVAEEAEDLVKPFPAPDFEVSGCRVGIRQQLTIEQGKRGADTIIIHPGTRFLRVGRATDAYPINVPHVIARKASPPVPPPAFTSRIPPFKTPGAPLVPVYFEGLNDGANKLPDDYTVLADPTDPVR